MTSAAIDGVKNHFLTYDTICSMIRHMTSAEKTFEEMRNNPKGDWGIRDLIRIAKREGVSVKKRGSGSHVVFDYPGIDKNLSVPDRRPVKPIYLEKFVSFIDAVREVSP